MKTITFALVMASLLLGASASRADDSTYRTDVNPALLYWQAFGVMPELKDEADLKVYQHFPTAPVDEQYVALAAKYDPAFRLVRRAAQLRNSCDWGIDMAADGPETFLPYLVKAKAVMQAALLRARCFLARQQEAEAVQDLVAVFVLGRRVGNDGVLISVLVQDAMQNLLVDFVVGNFYEFSPAGLEQLVSGIDAAPPLGTVSQCINRGERACVAWYGRKFKEIQAAHPGDEAGAIRQVRELLATVVEAKKDYAKADALIRAAGGTMSGLLSWLKTTESSYDEVEQLTALPYAQFGPAEKAFEEKLDKSTNELSRMLFPAIPKARNREFLTIANVEMLRAAVAYRLHGDAGFKAVKDPFGTGPFGFQRFSYQNVDRGFELRSAYVGPTPAVLIVVENSGPRFQVTGPLAGKPLPSR